MVSPTDISPDDLRDALEEVDGEGKAPTLRLMAAINYLEEDDATLAEVAERYGYTAGWLSQWFNRLQRLPEDSVEDVVYDKDYNDRPGELSDEQYEQFVAAIHEPPKDAGFPGREWSVPMVQRYLDYEFGVQYSDRHIRRLLSEAGLSPKVSQPEFYEEDQPEDPVLRAITDSATTWTPDSDS